jgi:hypothetical protein
MRYKYAACQYGPSKRLIKVSKEKEKKNQNS